MSIAVSDLKTEMVRECLPQSISTGQSDSICGCYILYPVSVLHTGLIYPVISLPASLHVWNTLPLPVHQLLFQVKEIQPLLLPRLPKLPGPCE